jgi:hypothetical protein
MSDQVTTAGLEEKQKLRKHFGRFDIFFFLICTLVGLDTLGAALRSDRRRSPGSPCWAPSSSSRMHF